MNYKNLVAAFSQPSTYNGLASLSLLFGISDSQFQGYALAIAGVFSFVGIVLKEGTTNA